MLVTITNTSGVTMNDLDSYSGGSGPSGILAVGGSRKFPLPYPFGHIGALANSGSKQLAMKPRDFHKRNAAETFEPGEEWNVLVQAGKVTFAIAAESTNRDPEEEFIAAVV